MPSHSKNGTVQNGRGSNKKKMLTEKNTVENLITDAVINKLDKHYPGIKILSLEEGMKIEGIPRGEAEKAKLDLKFYFENPKLPLENLCSRLDNYHPVHKSQVNLLGYAHQLLGLDKTASAGLFIWGDPGVGKSHIAVGLAKEFMLKGQECYYLSEENHETGKFGAGELGPGQVWILDDLNSPYGVYMRVFKEIVLNAHNRGGRIFVTSNTPHIELMDDAFVTDKEDRERYMDRTKGMFKVLEVWGPSKRQEKTWHGGDVINI
ncbi:MAG: hypothetical protein JSW73_01500 [Candidatus Woesearchaeota archaeon]|nr:MAG: hypothetical protein JSW73_01500 [Candidatus Woesearchaeota archaeon]